MQIDKDTALEGLADKLATIKDLKSVAIIGVGNDGTSFLITTENSLDDHRYLAKEIMKAGTHILKDLAANCTCEACSEKIQVH